MASKKEPKAKTKKERVGKDDTGEGRASKKPKAVKAPKKTTTKKGAKNELKRDPAKHHKIQIPVTMSKEERGGTAAGAELDPFEVAKQRVKGSVPAIVDAMVEKAKQGSCTHAKTLLEMTGAKHMFDSEGEGQGGGEPWAKLVLERLDEADAAESASVQEEAQEIGVEQ